MINRERKNQEENNLNCIQFSFFLFSGNLSSSKASKFKAALSASQLLEKGGTWSRLENIQQLKSLPEN